MCQRGRWLLRESWVQFLEKTVDKSLAASSKAPGSRSQNPLPVSLASCWPTALHPGGDGSPRGTCVFSGVRPHGLSCPCSWWWTGPASGQRHRTGFARPPRRCPLCVRPEAGCLDLSVPAALGDSVRFARPGTSPGGLQRAGTAPAAGPGSGAPAGRLLQWQHLVGAWGGTHTRRVLGTSSHNPDGWLVLFLHAGYGDECFFVRSCSVFDNNRQDPTGLTAALQATDLAGVLHMLYCVLFHGTLSDPGAASPKESFPQSTVQVAIQSLRFLNSFAALDLPTFQVPSVVPRWCLPAGVTLWRSWDMGCPSGWGLGNKPRYLSCCTCRLSRP